MIYLSSFVWRFILNFNTAYFLFVIYCEVGHSTTSLAKIRHTVESTGMHGSSVHLTITPETLNLQRNECVSSVHVQNSYFKLIPFKCVTRSNIVTSAFIAYCFIQAGEFSAMVTGQRFTTFCVFTVNTFVFAFITWEKVLRLVFITAFHSPLFNHVVSCYTLQS